MSESHIDAEAIRKSLVQERADLVETDAAAAADSRPVALDQQSVGRLSRMDALQMQAMAKAVAARRRGRLHRIERALRRLDEGEFGYCGRCGEDIAPKRLALDPTVERCIGCAG